jgi:uncharacterized membrane protein (DUF106 family)
MKDKSGEMRSIEIKEEIRARDFGAELIEDLSNILNLKIQEGMPYPIILEAIAALTAMALNIVNPLTQDKERLEKFRTMLSNSLAAYTKMNERPARII